MPDRSKEENEQALQKNALRKNSREGCGVGIYPLNA